VAGPAAAAVRLLSLDPFSTHATLARLGPLLDELTESAVASSYGELDDLPACGAPLLDIAAEDHAVRDMRLFAS
jgi:urease accessory protein